MAIRFVYIFNYRQRVLNNKKKIYIMTGYLMFFLFTFRIIKKNYNFYIYEADAF